MINYKLAQALQTTGKASKCFRALDKQLQELRYSEVTKDIQVLVDTTGMEQTFAFSSFTSLIGFDFITNDQIVVDYKDAVETVKFVKYKGGLNVLLIDYLSYRVLNDEDNAQALSILQRVRVILKSIGEVDIMSESSTEVLDILGAELKSITDALLH